MSKVHSKDLPKLKALSSLEAHSYDNQYFELQQIFLYIVSFSIPSLFIRSTIDLAKRLLKAEVTHYKALLNTFVKIHDTDGTFSEWEVYSEQMCRKHCSKSLSKYICFLILTALTTSG